MTDPNKLFTVLLAEDEPADAYLVRLAFEEGRILVDLHHVPDGVEALAFLQGDPPYQEAPRPDLILLDLNMPRMDGRRFLEKVKEAPGLRSIPVVILTTSDAESDIEASYDRGAAGFIVKPVEVDQFVAAVRGLQDYWITLVRRPAT